MINSNDNVGKAFSKYAPFHTCMTVLLYNTSQLKHSIRVDFLILDNKTISTSDYKTSATYVKLGKKKR